MRRSRVRVRRDIEVGLVLEGEVPARGAADVHGGRADLGTTRGFATGC